LDLLHPLLAMLCGSVVGFTLGLIGGGGSIMATPLLLYVVGLQPHVAIGTGALAVSANAFVNFCGHLRVGNVRWRCSIVFSVVGVAGAIIGSLLGQQIDGKKLVFLFAILMIVVGVLMLRRKDTRGLDAPVSMSVPAISNSEPRNLLFLVGTAFAVGVLSGFFGIGGGFLIVPGLLFATGMPMICAIGSSLLAVGAFGLTTSVTYGLAGLIDWPVAAEYLVGGLDHRHDAGHTVRLPQGNFEPNFRRSRFPGGFVHHLPQRCGVPLVSHAGVDRDRIHRGGRCCDQASHATRG
jgi:uncharacterized protein